MAKPNMLPILALGAAALFLMKKKGEPETSTNGEKANGNGKVHEMTIDEFYAAHGSELPDFEMKVGEELRLNQNPGDQELMKTWGAEIAGSDEKEGAAALGYHPAEPGTTLTFKPTKEGAYILHFSYIDPSSPGEGAGGGTFRVLVSKA